MEHRCSVRVPLALDVVIKSRSLGLVSGRTRNVGVGGMLVDTGPARLPVNTLVETSLVMLEQGREQVYDAFAVVIHSSDGGTGLMFSDMDPALFNRLHQLVFPSLAVR